MRIIQMLPSLSFGDAVGNDTRAIRDILREEGYDTEIYAENIDQRLPAGEGKHVRSMAKMADGDLLLYHASTGTQLNFDLPKYGGKQIMIYHNITPPEFFRWYNPEAKKNMTFGYQGIRYLADKMSYCIADSEFNRDELRRMGYTCPIDVCPILVPFADYDRKPNQEIIKLYTGEKKTNWLFVGRISPNKKQEDIIKAFYYYQQKYEPESRLFLIGNESGMEKYAERLRAYIRELGIEKKVIFPGHVPFQDILAYYRLADVFVCMSEHEGFCVPITEAMYFGIPIVAYRSCAVPETLGDGGLLTDRKEPECVAAAVNQVLKDGALRLSIACGQKKMLEQYSYQTVKARLMNCLKKVVE